MRNKRGFTLVELLVTLALVGIAATAVGSFSFLNQRQTMENKLLNQQQDDMRFVMETIVPYIRMGGSFKEDPVNTFTVYIPKEVFSAEMFVFGFNPSAGTVWIRDPSQPMCSNIADVNAAVDSAGLVALELISISTMPGVQHSLPITTKTSVMLRNHP